jgi:hypothetical protein
MNPNTNMAAAWRRNMRALPVFLRAEPSTIRQWIADWPTPFVWFCVVSIVLGAGLYGLVIGSWRDESQAIYTGLKLPMVLLLTSVGNGLLNGMLAPLLGLNVTLRQSFLLVLISFAVTAVLLGSLSPVALFVVWNTPPLTGFTRLWSIEYGFLQLSLATFVAGAGIAANMRLLPLLRKFSRDARSARNVLVAWLATNLFLGSQVAWVLRPFIWDPAGPSRFIGREYFKGSFFETVFNAAWRLIHSF